MIGSLPTSVLYAAIGGVSVLAGAVTATRLRLTPRVRSLVQHAAAGTVLAGLVVDVFSKLLARPQQVWFTALGMVAGLVAMLLIRSGFDSGQGDDDGVGSLVVTVLSDIVVDGVLIGLSAALGAATGLLFAIALAPEMGLLGVTATESVGDRWPRWRVMVIAAIVAAAITGAGALGWVVAGLPVAVTTTVLGLGASVIIYLIMEELLREAHELATSTVEVAVLFAFFLPFFLIGVALG